jgi:hypothetical protein
VSEGSESRDPSWCTTTWVTSSLLTSAGQYTPNGWASVGGDETKNPG